jgi:hypothetical protein
LGRVFLTTVLTAVFIIAGLLPTAHAQAARASVEPLPPDLPLPSAAPLATRWLDEAIILQPWRATQHTALTDVGDRPQRLRDEFGFNTIIVLPPAANNAGVLAAHRQTEEQFRAGLDAYRRAGYRVILYSSVVQSGLDPVWHNGHLEQVHPDWVMRDSRGTPVTKYGHGWLCPNSPALEYTIAYTERLARDYRPDAIMLDNNQFFYADEKSMAPETWACYCEYCQARFRDYVLGRFGPERAGRIFNVDPADMKMPVEEGPLRALWVHWRNRVWAETNEAFRARLRRVDPQLMFFVNHQYLWPDGVLSSDLQYEHEDVVLSESRELSSWRMSEKMLIGGALARGRPLWNYIGTFEEKDYTRLRPQEVVGPIIAASLAHGARPWIVYFGFLDSQGNPLARREMSQLLSWYAARPELFGGTRWSKVGVVVSPLNRNLRKHSLIPAHLDGLLRAGLPVEAVRDDRLSTELLNRFRVITLESSLCMDQATADSLAGWVRRGGTLISVPDAGRQDELCRPRQRSVLWEALALNADPRGSAKVGRGELVIAGGGSLSQVVSAAARPDSFSSIPQAGVELVPYETQGRLTIHLVRHEPVRGGLTVGLPSSLRSNARSAMLDAPGLAQAQKLTIVRSGDRLSVRIPEVPIYGVIIIE